MSAERAYSNGNNPADMTAARVAAGAPRSVAARYGTGDTLSYLDQMLGELGRLARSADEPMLAYLIAVAQEEAAARRAHLRAG